MRGGRRAGAWMVGLGLLSGLPSACRPADVARADFEARPAPELGDGFTLTGARGRVVLVAFGYTACPDVCPTTLSRLRRLEERLGARAERLEVAFVSVDPERDSAARLASYVHAFSARFHPVRLEGAELARVLDGYGVTVRRRAPEEGGFRLAGARPYAVDHTGGYFLVDPRGTLREHLPHDASPEQLSAAVDRLLAGERAR